MAAMPFIGDAHRSLKCEDEKGEEVLRLVEDGNMLII